ncbi:DUF4232 domain-containing protein [Streptomyces sp. NPDC006207]|nr:DUF4232 domain-containing protein [Streptomyces sp. PA03-5A]
MQVSTVRRAVPVLALVVAGFAVTACGPDTKDASGAGSSPSSAAAPSGITSPARGNSGDAGSDGEDRDSEAGSSDRSAGQDSVADSGSGREGGAQRCASSQLSVSIGDKESGAGTTHFQLVFRNTGRAACTLTGFPGVSFHGRDGGQVGNAAERTTGTPVATVTLDPDARAVVDAQAPNGQAGYSDDACALRSVNYLGVFPPGSKDQINVAWKASQCSGRGAGGLKVGPVRPAR